METIKSLSCCAHSSNTLLRHTIINNQNKKTRGVGPVPDDLISFKYVFSIGQTRHISFSVRQLLRMYTSIWHEMCGLHSQIKQSSESNLIISNKYCLSLLDGNVNSLKSEPICTLLSNNAYFTVYFATNTKFFSHSEGVNNRNYQQWFFIRAHPSDSWLRHTIFNNQSIKTKRHVVLIPLQTNWSHWNKHST